MAAGCANLDEHKGAATGAVVGGATCYVLCKVAGGDDKACALIAGGCAIAGGILGAQYDARRRAVERAATEQKIEVRFENVSLAEPASKGGSQASQQPADGKASPKPSQVGLVATFKQDAMFAVGSATLSERAAQSFREIGKVYARRFQSEDGEDLPTYVLVVGHTDSTGLPTANQRLSEERARGVAAVLAAAGMEASRLYIQGAGSSRPLADNGTAEGRDRNRRVELVEMDSEPHLQKYVEARRQDRIALQYPTADPTPRNTPSGGHAPGGAATGPTAERPAGARSPATSQSSGGYDFGGAPASPSVADLLEAIGPQVTPWSWTSLSPIAEARAAAPATACYRDAPRITGNVIRFRDGKALDAIRDHRLGDYLPGMTGTGWTGSVGNTTVGIGPVAVLKDGARAVVQPSFFLKLHAAGNKGGSAEIPGRVDVFEGEKGILYRVYAEDSDAVLRCTDVVLPRGGRFQAIAGRLFYPDRDGWRQVTFTPVYKTGQGKGRL